MIKELWRPLEWTVSSKGEPMAMCPSHYYTIVKDGEKYTVRRIRYQDSHKDDCTGFASVDDAERFAQNDYETKMAKWLNTDPLTDTLNWFKAAKPEPTAKDITTQLGCIFEEVAELAAAINFNGTARELSGIADELKSLTEKYAQKFVEDIDDIEALDATTDIKVTLVGFEYMMGYNGNGALKEVNASNWSKFENGKAVTDENGKIIKGSGYFKPELDKFVGGSENG